MSDNIKIKLSKAILAITSDYMIHAGKIWRISSKEIIWNVKIVYCLVRTKTAERVAIEYTPWIVRVIDCCIVRGNIIIDRVKLLSMYKGGTSR